LLKFKGFLCILEGILGRNYVNETSATNFTKTLIFAFLEYRSIQKVFQCNTFKRVLKSILAFGYPEINARSAGEKYPLKYLKTPIGQEVRGRVNF